MLAEYERTIAFYDLRLVLIHAAAADDPSLLGKLLSEVSALASRHQAFLTEGPSGSNRLSIREVRIEQDFTSILISSSDKSISNPVFENQDSGELRVAEKKPPEGIGTAAHVVLDTTQPKSPFLRPSPVLAFLRVCRTTLPPHRGGAKISGKCAFLKKSVAWLG
jgi:hypothetical protein